MKRGEATINNDEASWLVAKRLGRVISLVENNKQLESFVEINYDVLPVAPMPTESSEDERESRADSSESSSRPRKQF
jgi:hypothetical protein